MAKAKDTTTKTGASKTAKSHPTTSVKSAKSGGMMARDTGGVVAYTKGSRFKDADVLEVVERVLNKS